MLGYIPAIVPNEFRWFYILLTFAFATAGWTLLLTEGPGKQKIIGMIFAAAGTYYFVRCTPELLSVIWPY